MTMPMSQLVFNRDGTLMAGFDVNWNDVGIWETRNWQSQGMGKRNPNKATTWPKIWDIRFNPKDQVQCAISTGLAGKWILEPRQDGGVIEFPVPTLPPIRPHSGYIESVAFSPDQKQLFTYDGGMLCTWDLSNLKLINSTSISPPIRTFVMKRGGLMSPGAWGTLKPIISSDGTFLVTRGLNPHLILTRLQTNEETKLLLDVVDKEMMQVALRVGITPDGKRVVAEWTEFLSYDQNAQKLGRVEAWDTAKGNRLWSRPVLQLAPEESRPFRNLDQIQPLSFSSDGKSVAIAGGILDMATGLQQSDWEAPLPQIHNGYFDPNGKRLINFENNTCRFWDVNRGKLLEEWTLPLNGDRRLIGILPDGRTALLGVRTHGSSDVAISEIQWIELASHQMRARFGFEHQSPFALVGISPDGNTLVGTNKSNVLSIWRIRNPPKQIRLASKQVLEQHWKKVCEVSADEGWKAMLALAGDPDQTIPFVMEQLKQRPTIEQVQEWIEELGHSDFNRRARAGEKLAKLGKSVEGMLQNAAKSDSPERQRRAEKLLETLPGIDICRLRDVRAVELLETIGNAEAKKMLARLAGGARQDGLTQEAQAALNRLALKDLK